MKEPARAVGEDWAMLKEIAAGPALGFGLDRTLGFTRWNTGEGHG